MFDEEDKFEADNIKNEQTPNEEYDFSNYVNNDQKDVSKEGEEAEQGKSETVDETEYNAENKKVELDKEKIQTENVDKFEEQPAYEQSFESQSYNNYRQDNFTNTQSDTSNQRNGQKNNRVIYEKKNNNGFWMALAIVACTVIVVGGCIWASFSYFSSLNNQQNTANLNNSVQNNNQNNNIIEETTGEETKVTSTLTKADIDSTSTVNAVAIDVSDVVEEVMPTLVAITNTMLYTSYYGQTQSGISSGSGVIIGENGEELLIVTNAHVVTEDESTSYYYTTSLEGIEITFCNDTTVEAYVKGTDTDADLAVLAVKLEDIDQETRNEIKIALIGDSTQCKLGNGVVAIGNALGYGQSVTVGYISALEREVTSDDGSTKTMIQTDAAINPGNSGGGLFDMNGYLIGINSAKYSDTTVEGMGFAIPISDATEIIETLMNMTPRVSYSEEEQGYLGIQGNDVSSSLVNSLQYPAGVLVYYPIPGLAAEAAGIQMYDIITDINDVAITSMSELKSELKYYQAGETVTITLVRVENNQFKERQLEVTLNSYEDQQRAVQENSTDNNGNGKD
ncbi:MAG: S1C family serine protease [Lachnospiraceae bacterium]